MSVARIDQRVLQMQFGAFLKVQRDQWGIKQHEVLAHLPGWTQPNYSHLESGDIAPGFEQLLPIYTALQLSGVPWTVADRQQFLTLARKRIEQKKTHWEHRSDADWAELRYRLAQIDLLPEEPVALSTQWMPPKPLLAEIRHLVGREEWFTTVVSVIQETPPKKLIMLQGPVGVGKSSELHRLIHHFIQAKAPSYHVIWVPLLPVERSSGPEGALDVLLGTVLAESGTPPPSPSTASWANRMRFVLAQLEQSTRPVVMLIDNAESMLTEEGALAACWEEFLSRFLRSQHQASLVLATKEWPGWPGRERLFVSEITVPPLTMQTSVQLLQQLGLEGVPVHYLRKVSERVGGIPLCLEWVATLVQDPLLLDDWESFDFDGQVEKEGNRIQDEEGVTQRLVRLLEEPTLLRGHMASKLKPLLERIIEKRLPAEARQVLNLLAVTNIPLGKPALKVLCERPGLLKELRDASLLVAYPHRVQLLPMVASVVLQQLAPEQVKELEEQVIKALICWLEDGTLSDREAGNLVTELAVLLLKHQRLLEAAQLLIYYGWFSFNLGQAPRLARFADDVMKQYNWRTSPDIECGGLLLYYFLFSFLGKTIDEQQRATDYYRILEAVFAGKVILQHAIEVNVIYHLMVHDMNELQFEEAQALLEACCERLAPHLPSNIDLQASLLEKRARLFGRWSEYAEEQGEIERASELQEQAVAIYKHCITLLSTNQERSPLKSGFLKKRLARAFNNLGYHLNRVGQYEEALQAIEQSIILKEQGYVEVDTLADAYGEKSQILASLGRFQEALYFDEKALAEVQRLANAGHTFSKEEEWIYCVNRGCLYLRLGRVDEAEQLLREALPHIHPRRRIYRMFAKDALDEIGQWRLKATSPQHQLDWQWVERYRKLASFDSYWWLAPAGPFTEAEQQQWDQLFSHGSDTAIKEQLGALMVRSRERELTAAIAEQHEPRLSYPAIAIEDVRSRIAGLLQLDADIAQDEPNAIVRRLYHETIEEELWFLRLIEATYEGDSEKFWEYDLRLNPAPTPEEMHYTLSRVRYIILQGLLHPETAKASERLTQFMRERLHLSLDLSYDEEEAQELRNNIPLSPSHPQRMVSAQTAKRFFEAALRESGYEEWQVHIDPNASSPRVEQGLRHLYLPESRISVQQIKNYLSHELAGHVARCIAGERSLVGLLGIHTKNSLETEEGLAVYHDIQTATLQGEVYDETRTWFGTLATGLASGVVTPSQTFLSLFTFFELFIFLYRLLKRPDQDAQAAQKHARRIALERCLRTYRGVPDLERAGVCYSKDARYLRGLRIIKDAIAKDEKVLDRLAVGVVALDRLPDLQELGIVTTPQPLRKLVQDPDLDAHILSFEQPEEYVSQ